MKKRELKELIEQGGGYFVEFKKQIGVSIKRWLLLQMPLGERLSQGVTDNKQVVKSALDSCQCEIRIDIEFKALPEFQNGLRL